MVLGRVESWRKRESRLGEGGEEVYHEWTPINTNRRGGGVAASRQSAVGSSFGRFFKRYKSRMVSFSTALMSRETKGRAVSAKRALPFVSRGMMATVKLAKGRPIR